MDPPAFQTVDPIPGAVKFAQGHLRSSKVVQVLQLAEWRIGQHVVGVAHQQYVVTAAGTAKRRNWWSDRCGAGRCCSRLSASCLVDANIQRTVPTLIESSGLETLAGVLLVGRNQCSGGRRNLRGTAGLGSTACVPSAPVSAAARAARPRIGLFLKPKSPIIVMINHLLSECSRGVPHRPDLMLMWRTNVAVAGFERAEIADAVRNVDDADVDATQAAPISGTNPPRSGYAITSPAADPAHVAASSRERHLLLAMASASFAASRRVHTVHRARGNRGRSSLIIRTAADTRFSHSSTSFTPPQRVRVIDRHRPADNLRPFVYGLDLARYWTWTLRWSGNLHRGPLRLSSLAPGSCAVGRADPRCGWTVRPSPSSLPDRRSEKGVYSAFHQYSFTD